MLRAVSSKLRGDATLSSPLPVHAPLQAAALAGVDVGPMLEHMGLPSDLVSQRDPELGAATWEALWVEGARRAADPAFALHAAERVPMGAYDVIDYIASNHATVGPGLRATVEYFRFARTGFGLALEDLSDGSIVVRRVAGPLRGRILLHRFSTEFTFAMILSRFRSGSGQRWAPTRATFACDRPDHAQAYEAFFDCPLSFAAAEDSLVIGPETLGLPQPQADSRLRRLIEQSAAVLANELPAASVTDRLRNALPSALASRDAAASTLARTLALSTRTLHRRLEAEGTTFHAVLDEVRLVFARRYLSDRTIGTGEAAFLLGFSDVRAFSRAFKRWSDTTPSQWRARRG